MSNRFPIMPQEKRIRRLQHPSGTVNMVLDTDTFNEIDDQFAIVYTLLSKDKLNLQAIYAAPFHNVMSESPKDGMEKSYEEIVRILKLMNEPAEGFVFRGSESYLPNKDEPVESEAARDLITKAMEATEEEPLYVVAIGAITNVASAILLEPDIIGKIVVVWLGGHALSWNDAKEFNLSQDVPGAQVLFDSGVPLVLIPVLGVSSHLVTTLPEIDAYVRGKGAIGDFLADRYESCSKDHYGYSRVIWDISTIAYLLNPESVPTYFTQSPVLNDQLTWSFNKDRHLIRCAHFVHRDAVFKDLFQKLEVSSRKG